MCGGAIYGVAVDMMVFSVVDVILMWCCVGVMITLMR